ncbi:NADPH-dependent FMN reductase [Estrella lausannensis]|uniref:NADPH-dependent FMN reductase-like domain-containing protein n=1 Tax=Estrella lausannensis TaxID=483423 RepID=A0A0H5E532_9BACT|nr:NAD(P)H-dependent oxidoreductase [Estrella lausannensis]CRX38350.1 hypothetical protein ELAC_1005 [Estrella lausannensis]
MKRGPKILAFAGSLRADSFNKKILKIAVKGAKEAGAEVNLIDLSEYSLPLLNQDEEAKFGIPPMAMRLKKMFREADGFLIASPEYNSSISGVLKNTLDWVSRPHPDEKAYLECFIGKTAAIISASPGGLGGLRGLVHLRAILGNINVLVIPDQVSVPGPDLNFDEKGDLKDSKKQESLLNVGKSLTEVLKKLKGYPA